MKLLNALPGSEDGTVSKISLLCLGLLWCQDDLYNKAECLFELITETRQLDEVPAKEIMFSDNVEE